MSTDPTQSPSANPPGPGLQSTPVQTQPVGGGGTPDLPSTPEERQMAMYCHLGAILPIFGAGIPLYIWNTKKDSAFIEDQAKEAANFLINTALILIICIIVAQIPYISIFGILATVVMVIGTIAMGVLAGQAANQGQVYRYPFNARYF